MTTKSFKELKAGLVKLIASQSSPEMTGPPPDESSALDGMDFLSVGLADVPIMLTYCEPVQADRVFLFCDFGSPPPELELVAMRRLMEMNFVMYRGSSPCFVRDPESDHIMMLSEIPLAIATPEDTFAYMHGVASQAIEWRKNYFLPPEAHVASAPHAMV